MKKVSIMTWYKYMNYGSALQSVALYKKVADLNCHVDMISYTTSPDKYRQEKNFSPLKAIYRFLKQKISTQGYFSEERKTLFEKFLYSRISETTLCDNYSELYQLNDKYDAFICGSDQVWSLSNSFDDKYFLSFVDRSNLKIAYAPSFGLSDIQIPEMGDMIKTLLERFDHLSVRESVGVDIIKKLTGRDANLVLDPTLLLSTDEWDSYADVQDGLISGKYIICYFLGDGKEYIKNVKRISRDLKIPYYIIPALKKDSKDPNRVPFEVGPAEFVSLIKNAEYVCTDSFHGLSFSVNYKKPFTIYKRFKDGYKYNQNSRIESLLDLLGLNERLLEDAHLHPIDYLYADTKLREKRDFSIAYLKNALCDNSKQGNYNEFRLSQDMCTGCGACANICGKRAITVDKDENGFYHYTIDKSKCVDCGICNSVCPLKNAPQTNIRNAQGLYALKHKSIDVLKKSSSGGASHAIAEFMLRKGSNVCGVTYNPDKNAACHILIDDTNDLYKIQGSKYLQSECESAISALVSDGKPFVFFGTPCQVAGLDLLLKKKQLREKALLVEVVCHGVQSGYVWDKYISEVAAKNGFSERIECVFRNKEYPWHQKTLTITSGEKQCCAKESDDVFYAFFKYPIVYMPTCYECQFREKSSADIRIGDFWGSEFENDNSGVSLVVAVSDKGKCIVEELDTVDIRSYDVHKYFEIQTTANPQKNILYNTVLNELKVGSANLTEMRQKYCTYYDKKTQYYKCIQFLKKIVRRQ